MEKEEKVAAVEVGGGKIKLAQSDCTLKSVKELRKEVIAARHEGMYSLSDSVCAGTDRGP